MKPPPTIADAARAVLEAVTPRDKKEHAAIKKLERALRSHTPAENKLRVTASGGLALTITTPAGTTYTHHCGAGPAYAIAQAIESRFGLVDFSTGDISRATGFTASRSIPVLLYLKSIGILVDAPKRKYRVANGVDHTMIAINMQHAILTNVVLNEKKLQHQTQSKATR